LATGGSLSAPRFLPINTTFPYEPPYSANDPVPTFTYNISNSQMATQTTTSEDDVKVGLTVSGSGSFLGFASFKLQDSASWEWTNKSSNAASSGTSQSAQLTIGGPGYGFSGPSMIQVYYDTVYRTFAFSLNAAAPAAAALTGKLLTFEGKPLADSAVRVVEGNGKTHVTYTNRNGIFRLYGQLTGPATVQAEGLSRTVKDPSSGTITLQKPR